MTNTTKRRSPVEELLEAIQELGGTVSRSELLGLLTKHGLTLTRRKVKPREED